MHEYDKTGILSLNDLDLPNENHMKKGVAIIECVQEIPCNPCVDSCPVKAISMKDINALPIIDFNKCIGCGQCIGICPGLAIFLVKIRNDKALISIPYEFLPVPKVGDCVLALDRSGIIRDKASVKRILKKGKTMIITIEVAKEFAMEIRNIRVNL